MWTKIKNNKDSIVTGTLLFGPVVVLSFIIMFIQSNPEIKKELSDSSSEFIKMFQSKDITKKEFPNIEIEASSAIVKDLNTGEIIYKKESNVAMPLASVTKVMTALVAKNVLENNQEVRIGADHIMEEGDNNLLAGERWKLSDLLDFTLVGSSNDGAAAIASAAGNILRKDSPKNFY